MYKRLSILLFAGTLAACGAVSVKYSTAYVDDKNRGAMPVEYEKSIRSYLETSLKDPGSLQMRPLAKPVEGHFITRQVTQSAGLFQSHGVVQETRHWAWVVYAQVNAKNSYGGYVGWKPYRFSFRGESIVDVETNPDFIAQTEASGLEQ